jgi:hypothetical protein
MCILPHWVFTVPICGSGLVDLLCFPHCWEYPVIVALKIASRDVFIYVYRDEIFMSSSWTFLEPK